MLAWTVILLIAALHSGLLGLTEILPAANGIACAMFFILLVMFSVALMTRNPREA